MVQKKEEKKDKETQLRVVPQPRWFCVFTEEHGSEHKEWEGGRREGRKKSVFGHVEGEMTSYQTAFS